MTERAFHPMRVGGVGLCSAHEGDTLTALRKITDGVARRKRHPTFVGADGMKQLCAPVPGCETERDTVARVSYLAANARTSLHGAVREPQLSVLLLPALLGPGSPLHEATQQAVSNGMFGVVPDEVIFGGTSAAADKICDISVRLHKGDITDCLFVCADTRISPFVLDIMEVTGRAPVRAVPHAPLPGELGVALYLCPVHGDGIVKGQTVTHFATAQEPYAPDDKNRSLMGRASVPAFLGLGSIPDKARLLVDADGQRHKAEEVGVILSAGISVAEADVAAPSASIGTVGCATLPLFLGTGLALLFDEAPAVVGWICGDANERFVLHMQ